MVDLSKYIITEEGTIIEALGTIDSNKQGFVIVVDKEKIVRGILTDGDIRRGFLAGTQISDKIDEVFMTSFEFVNITEKFDVIINKFKSEKVRFLPIVDDNMKLINIITKRQFHLLLIEDIDFDLHYNFMDLDESILDHEIYDKPWGFYKTTFLNPYVQAKIIKVYPGGELSLQKHMHREEHWVVIKGEGELILGASVKQLKAGDYIFIPKECKHKVTNLSKDQDLLISEIQLGDYFGEDDIIRYEDKYGRHIQK